MKAYRVLVVEDHPFQHEHVLYLLSHPGCFHVDSAWDGPGALKCLDSNQYDLIISDLFMPEMDGVQLIQKLAQLPRRPALALMSVASRRMLVSAGLVARNLGIDVIGLMSKPVEATAIERLRAALDERYDKGIKAIDKPLQLDRQQLLDALQTAQLQPWFQPKKSLRDGRICGAEALVRWQHPQLGTLLPGVFLSAVERFGLEEQLLWLMLERTVEAQARWRQEGYDVLVSINLPTHLLDSHDLADRLKSRVLAMGARPRSLCFELLETSTTRALGNYYAGACRLRMMGFGLAQDDFGKGFSSFFSLVSTPFTELKIDRSLVSGCVDNESWQAALHSIVELSAKLGLTVTAEGVETYEELAFLRKIQCDQAQGFLISKAITAQAFSAMLRKDGFKPALK